MAYGRDFQQLPLSGPLFQRLLVLFTALVSKILRQVYHNFTDT